MKKTVNQSNTKTKSTRKNLTASTRSYLRNLDDYGYDIFGAIDKRGKISAFKCC